MNGRFDVLDASVVSLILLVILLVDRSAQRHHRIPEPSFDVHNHTDADQQNWQDRHGIEMEAF